jgi:hypothetical protein
MPKRDKLERRRTVAVAVEVDAAAITRWLLAFILALILAYC